MYTCAYQRGGGGFRTEPIVVEEGVFVLMCLSKGRRRLCVPGRFSLLACGNKTGDAFQYEWCSRLTR